MKKSATKIRRKLQKLLVTGILQIGGSMVWLFGSVTITYQIGEILKFGLL